MKGKTNSYQIVLVFAPKTKSEIVDGVVAKLTGFFEAMKAEIKNKESLGTKELVYEIKGNRKGEFWQLDVEAATPMKLTEVNLFLNRDTNVIRYLILKN